MKLQTFDLTGENGGRVLLDTARENLKVSPRAFGARAGSQTFDMGCAQNVCF